MHAGQRDPRDSSKLSSFLAYTTCIQVFDLAALSGGLGNIKRDTKDLAQKPLK